ncbi:type II toxin-antitoxin system RelE family toxin [Archaeoglobus fulgidus]|jgi:mRNA interferase RelE/StbE|uniref:Type II toxin-antitoxin system RelE/ParE family toxin n=3 Tax=Archaeoglobus fulgidus TaxID=2234 RepID=O29188_ARCFU|nr:type II toxin-antitoxin system RelE/ParE family toxin [Archaeoglobus fulgidus]AAB90153.1 conserved hypothetical protein [Archaeoglobus fulgidus DSM 4304]AIG97955.1 Cytotoxic translational repressor of toxin-antitoxin stability system [Archaeoglobus fulgidus DSM 8774]KUJ94058.1 MAG: hypothetical protein XD40_0770 [Archaeoglobus fulgidus]KUK05837.1 MAG: hypothetical protein XD48_1920 [Archaeoglobus fulgidus]
MAWKVRYHKKAIKFLEKLDEGKRSILLSKIQELVNSLESGVLPIQRMDIKRLKGVWDGFLRLRVGEVRIIFKINVEDETIFIYSIHFREKVY